MASSKRGWQQSVVAFRTSIKLPHTLTTGFLTFPWAQSNTTWRMWGIFTCLSCLSFSIPIITSWQKWRFYCELSLALTFLSFDLSLMDNHERCPRVSSLHYGSDPLIFSTRPSGLKGKWKSLEMLSQGNSLTYKTITLFWNSCFECWDLNSNFFLFAFYLQWS